MLVTMNSAWFYLTLKMYEIIFFKSHTYKIATWSKNDIVHFQGKIKFRCDTFANFQPLCNLRRKKLKFSFMCTSLSHAYV